MDAKALLLQSDIYSASACKKSPPNGDELSSPIRSASARPQSAGAPTSREEIVEENASSNARPQQVPPVIMPEESPDLASAELPNSTAEAEYNPSTPPPQPICALAQSALAYRARQRQAETQSEQEWQEMLKKTAVRTHDDQQEISPEKERGDGLFDTSAGGPRSIAEVYALCKQLSEAYLLPISEVKSCYEDFRMLDYDGNFALSAEEFERAVRQNCRLREDEPLPENLAVKYAQMDHDGNHVVTFREYVRWSQGASWSEHLLVRDERDRESRRLAKKHGIHLLDIDRLRRLFDIYDVDRRRVITQEMFSRVILGILKVTEPSDVPRTRLDRYWREIDLDRNGTVDFEEFVIWMIDRGPEHLMLRREWIKQTLAVDA